ncbi:hypothetical protein [Nitrosomonas sp.]|uniref:hypothetical protein n=1 Tax=Nitrosomonas sp. TaxID=42353 RepID=UPI0025D0F98B|nr:hypothetical protein [Nitrosomonas sp.]
MKKTLKIMVLGLVVLVLLSACSTAHKSSQTRRTAIEQLLLSEAVTSSLSQRPEIPLMVPKNASVLIDISGISTDKGFVREVLAGWLGQQGYLVQTDIEKAHYQLSIIVESLGTEYGESFFGMPQVSSTFIPVSLPELALYKAQYQTGYVKFYCNIFELPTGRFIQSTPSFIAETFYNEYTVLFVFSFKSTNLLSPPQVGTFRDYSETQAQATEDMQK